VPESLSQSGRLSTSSIAAVAELLDVRDTAATRQAAALCTHGARACAPRATRANRPAVEAKQDGGLDEAPRHATAPRCGCSPRAHQIAAACF